jgi:hypothetical protein
MIPEETHAEGHESPKKIEKLPSRKTDSAKKLTSV